MTICGSGLAAFATEVAERPDPRVSSPRSCGPRRRRATPGQPSEAPGVVRDLASVAAAAPRSLCPYDLPAGGSLS